MLITMSTALGCGFLHHLVQPEVYNFERLHIFLFNLCSGGTLLVYVTEDKPSLSFRGRVFFLLSLVFALTAFMQWYAITLVVPLILAGIIEKVRIEHFGRVLPLGLFSVRETVSRKFHQASLLCLTIGLTMSSPVILNDVYLNWLNIPKLQLDTFFLGFSFPISLISMSVIFALMQKAKQPMTIIYKQAAFWIINVGVIVFFLFILANLFLPQVFIALILFCTVALVLYLYWHEGIRLQQKAFLTSGIFFLLCTSITGIIYILWAFSGKYDPQTSLPLLRLHSFTALYGWNLSGLIVISRHDDFPIQLHSHKVIALHWITVVILCPLGYFYQYFAIVAVAAYFWLLQILFFNHGKVDRRLVAVESEVLAETVNHEYKFTPAAF